LTYVTMKFVREEKEMYSVLSWSFRGRCVDFLKPTVASRSMRAHEILSVALVIRVRLGLGKSVGGEGFTLVVF
jgi:hypothetical protein